MRTFEFNDGRSKKFWNIELSGRKFTVTYGRIGTAGQTQSKTFADDAKARAAHDKLIAEKVGKGYVEKTAGKAAAPPTAKVLENAILANPDDLGARAAYADWLLEQGNPRGEFIQVQLALEDEAMSPARRKELQKRERALLKKHEEEWLGKLGPLLTANPMVDHPEDYRAGEVPNYRYRFARGFLDTLHITQLTLRLARALRDGPQVRFLQRLEIDDYTNGDEVDEADDGDDRIVESDGQERPYYRPLAPLLQVPRWDSLQYLRLGSEIDMDLCLKSEYGVQHHAYLRYCSPLYERMPRLEELHLLGKSVDVDRLFASKKLPNLRVLRIYHLGTDRASRIREGRDYEYPLTTLARNPAFQNLTQLLFHPHHEEYYHDPEGGDRLGCFLPLAQVQAILRSKHLKKLTHLQLRLSNMGDAGCQEIVASGILKQLKVLDLRHGCISDAGADILAACPDLKHLDHLDLCRNGLTAKGIRKLKATGVSLAATHQQTPDELAEEQYLRDGDSE
ncbi:MAG: WGR domain-containing protein [Gemmataceae bacterium]